MGLKGEFSGFVSSSIMTNGRSCDNKIHTPSDFVKVKKRELNDSVCDSV